VVDRLWAPILAAVTSAAYVLAVLVAGPLPLPAEAIGLVTFNLIAMALITYIAAVIGREQRRAREEALRLSRFDLLTGLFSRAYLIGALEQEIRRAARAGRPFGLLMIDLDGLKAANDRFGHDSGDQLLREVADVLRRDIRVTTSPRATRATSSCSSCPRRTSAGRAGGREDQGRHRAPGDRQRARGHPHHGSIGLVTYPDDGRSSSELMRRADLAMYEAKRRGRDQIVRFARQSPAPPAPPPARATSAAPSAASPVVPLPSPGPAPWERGVR